MSAWILGLLPFSVGGMMLLLNPEYISVLWTDPAGIKLLYYAGAMIVVGVIWLRKTIRIHV
jgi:tight adherence protein B